MPDPLTIAWALAQALPVALAGCALAVLLRLARLPGGWRAAGLAGGLLAGTLLGQTGLNRLAPAWHERIFVGGQRERLRVRALEQEHEAARAALERTGVSAAALAELDRRHADQADVLTQLQFRERNRRSDGRAGAIALALSALLLVSARRSPHPWRRRAPPWSALSAGAGFALLPSLALGLVLWRAFSLPPVVATALAATVGAGWPSGPGREADPDADRSRIADAGAVALALALGATLVVIPSAPVFFALLVWVGVWLAAPARVGGPAWLAPAATCAACAVIAGLAVIPFDLAALLSDRRFWIALAVAVLVAADGRAVGAWVGWRLAGERHRAWRSAAGMLGAGVGPAQIALAALVFLSAGAPWFPVAAIALAAVWVEVSAPLARRFAPALDSGRLP